MTTPLVSVCLPNLNTFAFLQERIDTILAQTWRNWELIVSDNYSDDGAWQLFERLAAADDRVSIKQEPREGLYPNWNNCLRRCRGEYVYIATSDDTMAPDCLERMVAALEAHPDCDLAHCPVVVIDHTGATVDEPRWPQCVSFGHGLGDVVRRPHVRRAPYDGLIHLTGQHVVLSITQLLIRRSLFERTGEFSSRWGSVSDFNWEMRACLLADMVHVPDTWGSWRLHPGQATASVQMFNPERDRKCEEMIEDALAACLPKLAPDLVAALKAHWLDLSREMRGYYAGLRNRRVVAERRKFQLQQLVGGSGAVRSQMFARALGRPRWPDAAPGEIRQWLEAFVARPVIEAVPPAS